MALHNLIENLIHELRYREVTPHLRPCRRMADLGCRHDHHFLTRVRGLAESCWGLDITIEDGQDGNITLLKADITKNLPFEDGFLDQITILAVLEHIADPKAVLAEVRRCLAPGGRLIVTTPTKLGIKVHDGLVRTRLVRDVEPDEHKDFDVSPQALAQWAREAGLIVEDSHSFELGMNAFLLASRPASR